MTGALLIAAALSVATNSVQELQPVEVWGERLVAAAVSPADAPWREAGAAFAAREQGPAGGLADLSVNAGAFSESGVVLGGAPLRNAHTEHFNADLPVPSAWIGAAAVPTALDLARRTAGHTAGALALELSAPPPGASGGVTAGAGLRGLAFVRADAAEGFAISDSVRGWAGAFVDSAHADRVDGYDDNSLWRVSAGGRVGALAENWRADLLVAGFWRDFGVRGAYGANEKYPAWEEDAGGMLFGSWKYDAGDGQPAELTVSWQREHDVYWLDRYDHEFYENRHTSDTVVLHGATRRVFAERFFIDLRSDTLFEIIRSRSLGDHSRVQESLAAIPGVVVGDWEFSLGPAADLFSNYNSRFSGAGGIAYRLDERTKAQLSYREAYRAPSYTELNYESPSSLGNSGLPLKGRRTVALDLVRERSQEGAGGVFAEGRVGVFYARSSHLVDWLKTSRSSAWYATDLGEVDIFGASGEGEWRLGGGVTLRVEGELAKKFSDVEGYASRYALDYPLAGLVGTLRWEIADGLSLSWRQGVEVWERNPVRRGERVRNVSRAEAGWELPFFRNVTASLGVDDLFDQGFEVFPGQRAAGISAYASLTWKW